MQRENEEGDKGKLVVTRSREREGEGERRVKGGLKARLNIGLRLWEAGARVVV